MAGVRVRYFPLPPGVGSHSDSCGRARLLVCKYRWRRSPGTSLRFGVSSGILRPHFSEMGGDASGCVGIGPTPTVLMG